VTRTEPRAGESDRDSLQIALEEIAAASRALLEHGLDRSSALAAFLGGVRRALAVELAYLAVADTDADTDSELRIVACSCSSTTLGGEIEGTAIPRQAIGGNLDVLPEGARAAAERLGAPVGLLVPLHSDAENLSALGLFARDPLGEERERLLDALAGVLALLLTVFDAREKSGARSPDTRLRTISDALAITLDEAEQSSRIADLIGKAVGAKQVLLWLRSQTGLELIDGGASLNVGALEGANRRAERAFEERRRLLERDVDGSSLTVPFGLTPFGVIELQFAARAAPSDVEIAAIGTVIGRAAEVIAQTVRRRGERQELERSRALLAFVAQATAELSLTHTLRTAVDRIASLLGIEHVGVYLCEEGALTVAAGRGLAGPHVAVAEHLLQLATVHRGRRSLIVVADVLSEQRLEERRDDLLESRIEAAVALPLEAGGEAIGLIALYPPRGRLPSESEEALLAALGGQLSIAVHNARLHERATRLGSELEEALGAERQASKQLGTLHEISRAFAQSLSLETTLSVAARKIGELADVDATVIRMLDERRERVNAVAFHVANESLAAPIRSLLEQPLPFTGSIARVFAEGIVRRLAPETAASDESDYLLAPFLAHGSTAVVIPVATPKEVLATVSLISLDPGRPIGDETVEIALAIAGQAALAIENARLYEQQKAFADSIQRSLLPDREPELEGLDVGAAYAASARVEVGGDLYDFMALEDGSLAVVLGDVTGHGVDAAADMAMAKFVFRSLAREHSEPGAFLGAANEVVVEEIALGKFVTLLYLLVDRSRAELACASAGHPPPRLVHPDGRVESLDVRGLALGVLPGQHYEELHTPFAPGTAVVLYTDGVVEARRGDELYGVERLDELLARNGALGAKALAEAVLADCREFSGDQLFDDCAVVVVRAR